MSQKTMKHSRTNNDLLKQALKNPGIFEISKFYEDYRELSKQISTLSSSVRPRSIIITSNTSA